MDERVKADDKAEKTEILDVVCSFSVSGRLLGDVMEEAWEIAHKIGTKRLSFNFNSHKITIEKEE